jgi:hypothetical protein
MRLNEIFQNDYLKADDLGEDDMALTIKSVEPKEFQGQNGKEWKAIVHFRESEKSLVANKTNCNTIAEIHGDETDNWIGKRIALYATEVEFGGKTMLGIRVRLRAPGGNGAAVKQAGSKLTPDVAKGQAWLKFKESNPGDKAIGPKFASAVKRYFGDVEPSTLTAAQWHKFAGDNFELSLEDAAADVLGGGPAIPEDEIPFNPCRF